MRLLVVLAMLIGGCRAFGFVPESERRANEQRRARADAADAEEQRRLAAWEAYNLQRQREQEAETERICAKPSSEQIALLCAQGRMMREEHERNRLAREREMSLLEHQARLQQQESEIRERQRRLDAIERAFPSPPVYQQPAQPAPSPPRNCTSYVNGNVIQTNCH